MDEPLIRSSIGTPPQPTRHARGRPRPHGRAAGLRRDLAASAIDASAYGAMTALGNRYLPAFALAIGLSEQLSGLVVTAPLLIGALLQLASPHAIRRLHSHRRWVVPASMLQGLSFLPLVVAALRGHMSAAALLLVATLYCAGDLACSAPWTTWITRIVPARIRPRYFARRNRMSQLTVLAGLLAAWPVLELAKRYGDVCAGFALLFWLAAASRLLSSACLRIQREAIDEPPPDQLVSLREFVARLRNERGHLLAYMVWMQVTILVAQAYFTALVLCQYNLPYWQLVSLLATEFLAKSAGLAVFGDVAKRRGARAVLWMGGLGLVPVTVLWLASPSFIFLVAIQTLSGLALGAYELASCLLVFDTIPDHERTSVMTSYNLFNSAAVATASLGAFAIIRYSGASWAVYAALFTTLALARGVAVPLLGRIVNAMQPRLADLAAKPAAKP